MEWIVKYNIILKFIIKFYFRLYQIYLKKWLIVWQVNRNVNLFTRIKCKLSKDYVYKKISIILAINFD